MMNEMIYQRIFDELSVYLEKDWDKLVVYLEYGVASYTFEFYEKLAGTYIKCFNLPNISDDALAKSFSIIDEILTSERKLSNDELWTNMTLIVSKTGDMQAFFDYTDLSNGTYQYMKAWKEKYLT